MKGLHGTVHFAVINQAVQIKHKAYRTEATLLKETTTKTVKVKNIQQILTGSTQIIATTIKEKDAKINEKLEKEHYYAIQNCTSFTHELMNYCITSICFKTAK